MKKKVERRMPKYKNNVDKLLQRIETSLRRRGRHSDARNFRCDHVIGIAYANGFTDTESIDKMVVKDWNCPLGDPTNYIVTPKKNADDLSGLLLLKVKRRTQCAAVR